MALTLKHMGAGILNKVLGCQFTGIAIPTRAVSTRVGCGERRGELPAALTRPPE